LKTLKDKTKYHSSVYSQYEIDLLFKKILLWPIINIFPGSELSLLNYVIFIVLDILRMYFLHPFAQKQFSVVEYGWVEFRLFI
jgi:hypothetical protein